MHQLAEAKILSLVSRTHDAQSKEGTVERVDKSKRSTVHLGQRAAFCIRTALRQPQQSMKVLT